jgi:hypothetical protein
MFRVRRHSTFVPALVLLALAAVLPRPAAAAGDAGSAGPRLRLMAVRDQGDAVLVSFRLENAFDERILDKLDSGLEIAFKHQVAVRRRRPWWFERNVVQKKILTSVVRDNLTGQYAMRRLVNGGMVETATTSDPAEMRSFLTEVRDILIPLPEGLPRDGRTEVRVRSVLETRFFLFFPYPYDTDWVSRPLPGPGPGEAAPERPEEAPDEGDAPPSPAPRTGGGGGAG